MKSRREAALRWILPFASREATVDFLGLEVDFVDAVFDLEEALLVVRGEDDERLEGDERDEEAWPPFCPATVRGNTKATAMNATPMRLSIIKLPAKTWSGGIMR